MFSVCAASPLTLIAVFIRQATEETPYWNVGRRTSSHSGLTKDPSCPAELGLRRVCDLVMRPERFQTREKGLVYQQPDSAVQ